MFLTGLDPFVPSLVLFTEIIPDNSKSGTNLGKNVHTIIFGIVTDSVIMRNREIIHLVVRVFLSPYQNNLTCNLNSYVPSCPQHLIINAIFLSPPPKNRLCRTHTSPSWPIQGWKGLHQGERSHSEGLHPPQEYRINYQVLLDDGNRIIIPQGNF